METTQIPFVAQTAKDYGVDYEVVLTIYNRTGGTPALYKELEQYLATRILED